MGYDCVFDDLIPYQFNEEILEKSWKDAKRSWSDARRALGTLLD